MVNARILLLLPAAAIASAQGHHASATRPADALFVGSEVCGLCHEDEWNDFFKNPHFKSVASGKESKDRTGCEGCHGPGESHIEAGGGRETIPRAFSLMKPEEALDTCLKCHASDMARVNIRRSEHTLNSVVCTACHSIHRSPPAKFLLVKKPNDLCYSCHSTQRAQFDLPSRHRVNEGFMKCTDCHNPHGSFAATWAMADRPRLVERALDSEQPCMKCHIDKRGPFAFEHPPVRVEGCASCHSPHGSTNSSLLRRPVVFTLCLECHTGNGNFGTRNNGITRQSSIHNMSDPRYSRCTTCHVAIHGSNADPFFLN
jgi:DmsE family decaheme c-type cytochrome